MTEIPTEQPPSVIKRANYRPAAKAGEGRKKVHLDSILAGLDKMGDEITARFGYKNDPVGEVESINTEFEGFTGIYDLEGEHLVNKLNLDMDPESIHTRMDLMKNDLFNQLYTEDQLTDYYKIREQEEK